MKMILSFLSITALLFAAGCAQNIPPPLNEVQFESAQLGLGESEPSLTVKINFTRETEQADTIILIASSLTLKYATDYTTDPAFVNDTLKLPFANKATSVSFKVNRVEGAYPREGDVVNFRIKLIPRSLSFGIKTQLTLSFSELTVGENGEEIVAEPQVGGAQKPNIVFVDLSANRQIGVQRDTWDLGFYAKPGGEFVVILNETVPMMARRIDKTDISGVTATDTAGFAVDMNMDVTTVYTKVGPPSDSTWVDNAKDWIDDPTGDLTKTAIAPVSATEAENKVYIIHRGLKPDGTPRGWKKIRVLKNGDGYRLRYADIADQEYQVWSIDRSDTYLFRYINFDTGPVDVEPRKEHWDIAFSEFSTTADRVIPGLPQVPYFVQDVVIQNRYEVRTAQVMTSDDHAYEDFGEADVAGVTWSTSQVNIATSWRHFDGNPQTGAPLVLSTDRFYVIRDVQGNIYKLKFTAFEKDGERGHPAFKYKLVKKADTSEK